MELLLFKIHDTKKEYSFGNNCNVIPVIINF